MNATESNLLIQTDQMSESKLVRLQDWELAYLRTAMLHQLEETLEESISDTPENASPHRKVKGQPQPSRPSFAACGVSDHSEGQR
jgi:hypothetical protein